MEKSLGIYLGASTINIVSLACQNGSYTVEDSSIIAHDGNAEGTLLEEIQKSKHSDSDYICIRARKAKDSINLPKITEPEAKEYALQHFSEKIYRAGCPDKSGE